MTLPALFSATLLNRAVPVPEERVMVAPARLLKVVGPAALICQLLLPWMSNRPALLTVLAALLSTCPPERTSVPLGFTSMVRLPRNLLPPVFMFSVAPLAIVSVPPPPMVPALQVLSAPLRVRSPVPLSVPPLCVKVPDTVVAPPKVSVPPESVSGPLTEDGPAISRLPAEMVKPSVAISLPTAIAVFTVTTGLAPGPRSISTVSPAIGATPVLQLLPRLKLPLESVFQTLTPVNVGPRCRKAFLLSTPCV